MRRTASAPIQFAKQKMPEIEIFEDKPVMIGKSHKGKDESIEDAMKTMERLSDWLVATEEHNPWLETDAVGSAMLYGMMIHLREEIDRVMALGGGARNVRRTAGERSGKAFALRAMRRRLEIPAFEMRLLRQRGSSNTYSIFSQGERRPTAPQSLRTLSRLLAGHRRVFSHACRTTDSRKFGNTSPRLHRAETRLCENRAMTKAVTSRDSF
jgi:hypothetical protein